jgi:CheY-like chemotaxis protein
MFASGNSDCEVLNGMVKRDLKKMSTPPWCGTHVLLVDDNTLQLRIGRRMLERLGCSVELAWNGKQALALCQQQKFDLILMDGVMPVMDGLEAAEAIRGLQSPVRNIPIIGTSSSGTHCYWQRASMDDYIGKPFLPETLERVLRAWTEGKYDRDFKRAGLNGSQHDTPGDDTPSRGQED